MNRQDAERLDEEYEEEELNRQDAKTAKEEKEEENEDEKTREKIRIEPGQALDELAHRVIGAAIEVHRHLGPGFLEGVYEEALAWEFQLRGIDSERQKLITVAYKETLIGEGRLDFLVGGRLIVELKAVDKFAAIHQAQVLSYLKTTRLQLGLLINFNVPMLKDGLQRVIRT